jgi:UDP-4-amino-4,6-dideoxy-N-acetyl-beta-L-altrosamine N-acetyltransferase
MVIEDAPMVLEWRNSEWVSKWMLNEQHIEWNGHVRWISNTLQSDSCRYWVIVHDERPVGVVFLADIDLTRGTCSWGIYLGDNTVRGRGVGMAASYLSISQAFAMGQISCVFCEVLSMNNAAKSLYGELGFIETGKQSKSERINGAVDSVIEMSLTRDDWLRRSGHIRSAVFDRLGEFGEESS